jgi:hypothetical protein
LFPIGYASNSLWAWCRVPLHCQISRLESCPQITFKSHHAWLF